jgi:transcriptional regulator GlxA family with amidase domain
MLDHAGNPPHRASQATASSASRNTTCRGTSPRQPSGGLAGWQIKRVKLYIDAHLADRIICRDMAGLVNLSTRHFSRNFTVSLGQSPHSYILRCRMEHAKLLMRTTSLALGQIAMQCGMADQSHFCRSFRRIVGDRPSVWRRNDNALRARTSSSVRSGMTGPSSAPAFVA